MTPWDSHGWVCVNSLRPSDAIWRQWFWTTLAQVMACCLTAPSHYLNQCWLIIRGVLWHTSESSFAGIAQGIDSGYEFEKDILKNIFKSPRGQWVKVHVVTPIIELSLSYKPIDVFSQCNLNIKTSWDLKISNPTMRQSWGSTRHAFL